LSFGYVLVLALSFLLKSAGGGEGGRVALTVVASSDCEFLHDDPSSLRCVAGTLAVPWLLNAWERPGQKIRARRGRVAYAYGRSLRFRVTQRVFHINPQRSPKENLQKWSLISDDGNQAGSKSNGYPMIHGSFDSRTLANMDVALEQICKQTPLGQLHETRARVAKALLRCAEAGHTTLGSLMKAGQLAAKARPACARPRGQTYSDSNAR
jgi:hypothetical protein